MSQWWVKSGEVYLSIETSGKNGGNPVLLLPGFSEPKSDLAYWLSNLAKSLSAAGYYVIQADLIGHGNSYGTLQEANIDRLEENIQQIIDSVYVRVKRKIIIIARGLSATLAFKLSHQQLILGCIGVNPFFFPTQLKKKSVFQNKTVFIRDSEGEEWIKSVFRFLGAEITNIEGQLIKYDFWKSITEYEWNSIFKEFDQKNSILRFVDKINDIETVNSEEYIECDLLQYFDEKSFSDDAARIVQLISLVKCKIDKMHA